MPKKWNLLPDPPQEFFDQYPELPTLVAKLLYNRKITTQEKIDEFLNPEYTKNIHDPFLFKDMEKAVQRIFAAVEKDEKIAIHGDYDADGVSAAVILTDALKMLGSKNILTFLPHREVDGYGMNPKTVEMFAKENVKLVITCDCGISNGKEVDLANEKNIDVIITDHHAIPETLPKAYAIIHPKVPGENYPDKGLAGGGVAFKLMQGLLKKHQEKNLKLQNGKTHESMEKWSLDMVAIASVADMVPLIGESRSLTKFGLIVLNKTKRIGLQKLLLEAKLVNEDGSSKKELSADTIGYHIAPRINAAGRMKHANVAYALLTTNSPIEAIDLAFELNKNNEERQKITEKLTEKSIEQVISKQKDSPFLFIYGKGWSTGIVGLIAGKIKEKYSKPTIVMAENKGEVTGSGRSIEGFNLIAAMQEIPEYFHKFGGHPMACGFTLKGPEIVEEFKTALTKIFLEKTKDLDLTPVLNIDSEIENMDEINWDLYDVLDKFKPFGQMNERPKYLAKNVTVMQLDSVGFEGKHLKMSVKHNSFKIHKTIGWNLSDKNNGNGNGKINWLKELKVGDKIDLVFEIDVNQWNGNRELQLTVIDLKKNI